MRKRVASIIILTIMLLTMATPVLGSDISAAVNQGRITVTNNSTAETNVATVFTANTTAWIANSLMNSSANNTAIRTSSGADVAYMPGYGPDGNPWALFVASIGADTQLIDLLFTGGSTDMASKLRYFPGSGGMTIDDDASMEPSDNFSDSWSGYINTTANGSNQRIVSKTEAFEVYVSPSVSGNITAAFVQVGEVIQANCDTEDGNFQIYTDRYGTQSFTVSAPFAVTKVAIYAYDSAGSPGDVDLEIYASDVNDKPTGAALTVAPAVNYNGFLAAWHDHDVADYILTPGKYNIVVKDVGGDADNNIRWHTDTGMPYIGGEWGFSINAGVDWTVDGLRDYTFRVYGEPSIRLTATAVSSGEHDVLVECTPNLLTNSSFAIGDPPDDWVYNGAGGSGAQSIVEVHEGTYSLALTRNGADARMRQAYAGAIAPLQGETLPFGGWAWSSVASNTRIRMADGINPYAYSNYHTGSSDWEFLTGTIAVDAACAGLNTDCFVGGTDGTSYYDGIIALHQTELPTDYKTLFLSIDGSVEDSIYIEESIVDNANDWVIGSDATPYIESYKHTVGGNLVSDISWEYAATFTDASSNGNDATPTFLTTSSDEHVSAVLSSYVPISEADAPAYTLTDAPLFYVDLPGVTSNSTTGMSGNFTSGAGVYTYPGSGVITAVALKSNVPEQLLVTIFSSMCLIILSLCISFMMKKTSVDSIFIKVMFVAIVWGFLVAVGVSDEWEIYFFTLIGLSLAWLSRQREAY